MVPSWRFFISFELAISNKKFEVVRLSEQLFSTRATYMERCVVFRNVRSSSTEKLLNYLRERIRINVRMVNLVNMWVKSLRQIQTHFFRHDF